MNIIQVNIWVITTKKGKGKLPLFCGNVDWVITIYGGVGGGGEGCVNNAITSLCCPCSSCDPSTDTEISSKFSISLLISAAIIFFFCSLYILFLLFLMCLLTRFEELGDKMKDGSILDDVRK